MRGQEELYKVRDFYDEVYYGKPDARHGDITWHHRVIARRLGPVRGKRVLDVACGLGQWLGLLQDRGAEIAGVDISDRAIERCRQRFPSGEFHVGAAEILPFADAGFDLITCMGSLEHFVDKPSALIEMLRVAKPDATFLILVPNAGFLPLRLGLFGGTWQTRIREDVVSLEAWQTLFTSVGLRVDARWRDLHVMDAGWVRKGRFASWPGRILLAMLLPFWPMAWQYQVHHLCRKC